MRDPAGLRETESRLSLTLASLTLLQFGPVELFGVKEGGREEVFTLIRSELPALGHLLSPHPEKIKNKTPTRLGSLI